MLALHRCPAERRSHLSGESPNSRRRQEDAYQAEPRVAQLSPGHQGHL